MRYRVETFCPMLWKAVFIDQEGQIFACCHQQPAVVGNIYEYKLEDICNNEIIQNFRQKSLDNQLKCFSGCTLLRQRCLDICTGLKKRDVVDLEKPFIADCKKLNFLQVTFGTACNIACSMCWQAHRNEKSVNYETLAKNIADMTFKMIYIQGGEPLFIEGAKKFFDYAASKGMKPCFLTNGMLITEEWAEKIAMHSPFLFISINAATKETHEFINRGSKWETVINNIQKVQKTREKYHTDVAIIGHMTIVMQNLCEISMFIARFKQLGFDSINFGYDISVRAYLKTHLREKKILWRMIKKAIKASKAQSAIDTSRLGILKLI